MFRRVKFVKLNKSKARIYYRIFIREILAITFIIDIESFLFLFNYTIERNNWSLKVGLFHFVKFVKLIKATIFITGYLSTEKLTCQRKKLHFYSLVRNGSWFPNNASPIRHGTLAASFIYASSAVNKVWTRISHFLEKGGATWTRAKARKPRTIIKRLNKRSNNKITFIIHKEKIFVFKFDKNYDAT